MALSLSCDLAVLERIIREIRPDILHMGAALELLSPADTRFLKQRFPAIEIMRSIPVTGDESIPWAKSYDGIADWLLLDSHKAGDTQIGALGITHDWSISARIVSSVTIPVILAGGLGPDNVAAAIRAVRPLASTRKLRPTGATGAEKTWSRSEIS